MRRLWTSLDRAAPLARVDTEPVRYCSAACRRRGASAADRSLEATIIALLEARSQGSTICPSEAVRALDPGVTGEALRAQMEPARRAARRLVNAGRRPGRLAHRWAFFLYTPSELRGALLHRTTTPPLVLCDKPSHRTTTVAVTGAGQVHVPAAASQAAYSAEDLIHGAWAVHQGFGKLSERESRHVKGKR